MKNTSHNNIEDFYERLNGVILQGLDNAKREEEIDKILIEEGNKRLNTLDFAEFCLTKIAPEDRGFLELIKHQKERFVLLTKYLDQNKGTVVIAGKDGHHSLGVGLAVGQWGKDKENLAALNIMHFHYLTKNLEQKHVNRVSFSRVGDNENYSKERLHVWGANTGNFTGNKNETISGGGQAQFFGKGHRAGVFGVVSTPYNGKRTQQQGAAEEEQNLNFEGIDKHDHIHLKLINHKRLSSRFNFVNRSSKDIPTDPAALSEKQKTNHENIIQHSKRYLLNGPFDQYFDLAQLNLKDELLQLNKNPNLFSGKQRGLNAIKKFENELDKKLRTWSSISKPKTNLNNIELSQFCELIRSYLMAISLMTTNDKKDQDNTVAKEKYLGVLSAIKVYLEIIETFQKEHSKDLLEQGLNLDQTDMETKLYFTSIQEALINGNKNIFRLSKSPANKKYLEKCVSNLKGLYAEAKKNISQSNDFKAARINLEQALEIIDDITQNKDVVGAEQYNIIVSNLLQVRVIFANMYRYNALIEEKPNKTEKAPKAAEEATSQGIIEARPKNKMAELLVNEIAKKSSIASIVTRVKDLLKAQRFDDEQNEVSLTLDNGAIITYNEKGESLSITTSKEGKQEHVSESEAQKASVVLLLKEAMSKLDVNAIERS